MGGRNRKSYRYDRLFLLTIVSAAGLLPRRLFPRPLVRQVSFRGTSFA